MSPADGRLIPALCEAAAAGRPFPIHGTGAQTRSMTYVDDAIRLMLLVMDLSAPVLRPVNIGNDEELSVLEITEVFAKVAGVPFEVEHQAGRPGDPQRRKPDNTLGRSLGWAPSVSLEHGLRETLGWLRDVSLTHV